MSTPAYPSKALAIALVLLPLAVQAASVPAATRIEVEAAVPAGEDARAGSSLRQQVVRQGIDEAVREVAQSYAARPFERDPLQMIGGSAQDFVLRYRVLEAIGERPARTLRDARGAPEREYAALIEVHVDTPRVTDALAALGLYERATGGAGQAYWIEAPLAWPAWQAFRDALLASGAARVVPEEISSGGMRIHVDGGRGDAASILARVQAAPPAGLSIRAAGGGEITRLELRLEPPEDEEGAPLD